MKNICKLFLIFAKIGLFAFGGGYVILPMLKSEFVEKNGWVTEEDIMDYFAIAQCTPGVIAVNSATFIGRKKAGFFGALAATLGVVFPSVIIISIIALFLNNFAEITLVKYALQGIRACVCGIILSALWDLSKKTIKDKLSFFISVVVFLAMIIFDISPIIFVICSAVLGIIVKTSKRGAKK